MLPLLYWDADCDRIRQVLDSLRGSFEVRCAATLVELHRMMSGGGFAVVILGISGKDSASLDSLARHLADAMKKPLFILGGAGQTKSQSQSPFVRYFRGKPDDLPGAVSRALRPVSDGSHAVPPIFDGRSPAILEVAAKVGQYAKSKSTVLVLGETGTGKDVAAKALHSLSDRVQRPFIALNCAAIPDGLLESELFGSEKGAFTDAVKRQGAVAMASGGTLFLDEIGSLSAHAQPRLLRALETGEYWRLGAEKMEKSDFRLISASCSNPVDLAEKGLFRIDLLYRIAVLVIVMPPLRQRIEDIEILAVKFCLEAGKGKCEISNSALDRLLQHSWPGNVRELKSVVARACANIEAGSIQADDIVFISGFRQTVRQSGPGGLSMLS